MEKKLYIVHGYEASGDSHWFHWLKDELAKYDVETKIMYMPNSDDPDLEEWMNYLSKEISELDENTYLIGHSLGTISVLRYLERSKVDKKIPLVILLSGFYEHIDHLPILDRFTNQKTNFSYLNSIVDKYIVIASLDDVVVPFDHSKRLAEQLNADFYEVDGYNHFMSSDGYDELPMLLELFKKEVL